MNDICASYGHMKYFFVSIAMYQKYVKYSQLLFLVKTISDVCTSIVLELQKGTIRSYVSSKGLC